MAKRGRVSPIIVDKNYIVIDGQHRVIAAKHLGYKVYAVVDPVDSLEESRKLLKDFNSVMKSWSNSDYKKLLELEEVKISAMIDETRVHVGSGVPSDTVLSVFVNKNLKYSKFKKFPIREMHTIYTENFDNGTLRLGKFENIIVNLKRIFSLKNYAFIDGIGKCILKIGIDNINVEDFCSTIRDNKDDILKLIPQTASEWKLSFERCL